MSTQTPNLWLIKQSGGERPLVRVLNDNMDKIDAAVGAVDAEQDGSLQEQIDNLQGSVSHKQVNVTYTASSNTTVTQCSCYRAGDVVMLFVQFHKQAATNNKEVLVTFSNLPAPVMDVSAFAANQTEGTTVTLATDGKMVSGGASSLVKDWLNAVFVYVTATQA